MPDYPETPEEARTWRYGQWGGNPNGRPYNPKKCAYAVMSEGFCIDYQCLRKPGHGPHGMFCRNHARIIEVAKGENNA